MTVAAPALKYGPRRPRPPVLATCLSFVVALFFGAVASGSIAVERSTRGQFAGVIAATVAIVMGAILLVVTTDLLVNARWKDGLADRAAFLISHVAGLTVAALLVHGILKAVTGLAVVECPGQFVNDAALVLPILALAWGRTLKNKVTTVRVALATMVTVMAYAGTLSFWHYDPFAGKAVQHFVLAETASACAILWIRDLLRELDTSS